ncbi:Zinc transporter ZTP29 [Vitis vinifera]|uniref:Zinc transporter ZTP29 n=1 Tax=Vitis vinifera TaxID=29760 RepID=A0A438HLY0_VITVI|nr:Zinc transporter ZTP29 [Vitis vinifera]
MDSQVMVALGLSLVGGASTSIGALFVILNETPNLKMLGLLQGFAAGLMLSISFLDLAHNALNSIGFLKGNLWFFAGVVFFAVVVGFIPEPTLAPSSDVKNKKVRMIYSPNKGTFTNYACICISTLGTSIIWAEYLKIRTQNVRCDCALESNFDSTPPPLLAIWQSFCTVNWTYWLADDVLERHKLAQFSRGNGCVPWINEGPSGWTKLGTGHCFAQHPREVALDCSHEFYLQTCNCTHTDTFDFQPFSVVTIARQGVAVALPVYFATQSKWQAFKLATLSGFAEPLGVIIVAYLFPSSLNPEILEGLLGSVGGVMAFLTLHEMLPLAFDYAGPKQAVKAVFFGMAFMSAR